jgi:hypothetical protein
LRLPPRGRDGRWVVTLSIALLLAIQPLWPDRTAVGVAGAIGLTLLASLRWRLTLLPVLVLLVSAAALRMSMSLHESSDVADVTRFALQAVRDGDNPYGVGYYVSRPPGAAFPYGPVALLWYFPFRGNPAFFEFLVSMALTGFFALRALRGRPMGLAIFALAPPIVLAAVDGSNDTSAGLFILAAIVLAARRPFLGAAALAVAVAFKAYAVAWLPALVVWAGLPSLLAFAGASVVAWFPVLFVWGPESYLRSLSMAQQTHLRQAYWSLASLLDAIVPGGAPRLLESLRYVAAGAVALAGARVVRSIDGVIVVGSLAFVVAQFGGYFGSYVYLAALAPVLCWRVDDWLRMAVPELVRAYRLAPEIARGAAQPVPAPAPAVADDGPARGRGRIARSPSG